MARDNKGSKGVTVEQVEQLQDRLSAVCKVCDTISERLVDCIIDIDEGRNPLRRLQGIYTNSVTMDQLIGRIDKLREGIGRALTIAEDHERSAPEAKKAAKKSPAKKPAVHQPVKAKKHVLAKAH